MLYLYLYLYIFLGWMNGWMRNEAEVVSACNMDLLLDSVSIWLQVHFSISILFYNKVMILGLNALNVLE